MQLIGLCLRVFIHHDREIHESEKQGWTGMAGGPIGLGLQVIGFILFLVLLLKWWSLISPEKTFITPTFTVFDWSCLIMSVVLMNLTPFLPKIIKNES